MRLSLKLLHAELACRYPDAEYIQAFEDAQTLSSSSILTPSCSPAEDIVYVYVPGIGMPAEISGAYVITSKKHATRFYECNLIVLPDESCMLEVPALVAEIFVRYYRWSDSLYEAIARNSDLQTLIDLTVPLLNQPMYFADASWKMVAYWGGDMEQVNPTWSYQMKFAYLPYNVYKDIIDADDMKTYRNPKKAILCKWRPGFGSLPFVSKAIRMNGQHCGNFFVIGLYRELDERDFVVAEHLGNVVATALYGGRNYLETSSLYSSHFIIDVIEGNLSSQTLIADQLHALRWSLSGDYNVALIKMRKDDAAIANHVMLLIRNIDSDVNSFVYQGLIVSVFGDYGNHCDKIRKKLGNLARSFNVVVAMGCPFETFMDIRYAYRQAAYVQQYADSHAISPRVVDFSECFLRYVNECSKDVAPMKTVIERLRDHDEQSGAQYCHTLYQWLLHERNTNKTAALLYIHRNTLNNRLANIDKLIRVDLDDPSIRLQLIVGLHSLFDDVHDAHR